MEKDNKILLGAVLIMLVAMLSFNFDSITGKAAGSGSGVSVSVDPSRLYFSAEGLERGSLPVTVTVRVKDGYVENGLDSGGLELFRANGKRIGGRGADICRTSSKCGKGTYTILYKFDSGLEEGDYYFQVSKRPSLLGTVYSKETFKSNLVRVSHYK
ncbi:hypothetical protein HYX16_01520 [Candidatus Woesearchaeota archaeon]|nr:hypothetical protein [Candidatus Woesearchaeota archaeon]